MEDYRTVRGTATGEYEEKKSRFIAQLSFAESEEAAVAFLEQVRAANRTARHNVYAYRLRAGNRERYSDDGEPAKTAGTPALEVLQHAHGDDEQRKDLGASDDRLHRTERCDRADDECGVDKRLRRRCGVDGRREA